MGWFYDVVPHLQSKSRSSRGQARWYHGREERKKEEEDVREGKERKKGRGRRKARREKGRRRTKR